jgi:hypothetical protein
MKFSAALPFLVLLPCLAMARSATAQVIPQGDQGGVTLSAGATASGFYLQYGERKMLGVSAFFDAETKHRIGIEGEARWLMFHQTDNVHATTYSIGARYHFNLRKFQPYAKGLVGIGEFNFPFNLATGSYLVVTAGGGVDYRLNRKIHLRLADFEYQYWPQFTYGAMTSTGVSAGLRYTILR